MNNRLNNMEQMFKQNQSVLLNETNDIINNSKIASVFNAINRVRLEMSLFSIMLIMWIVIRVEYHKNRFNYNGSLVNNNDFANDEFLSAHHLKPDHAMKS